MSHGPRVQGALAATAAAVCMLGLAASALAAGGATGDLLPGPGRCAGAAVERGDVGQGDRFTGGFSGGPELPAAGHEAGIGGMSLVCTGGRVAGLRLVQNGTGQTEAPAGENDEEGESRQAPGEETGEEAGEGAGEAADERAFEGSARPASPDLTVSEERALISGGWQ